MQKFCALLFAFGVCASGLEGTYLQQDVGGQDQRSWGFFFSQDPSWEEMEKIKQVLMELATKPIKELIADLKKAKKEGTFVGSGDHLVHIDFILSDPESRQLLQLIKAEPLKWKLLLSEFAQSCKKLKEEGALAQYVMNIAEQLRVDQNLLFRYVEEEDYKGMVDFLL